MGEADTIRRVRVNEDRMARGADDVSAGRVVLRDDAREGQHHNVLILALDNTEDIKRRIRFER